MRHQSSRSRWFLAFSAVACLAAGLGSVCVAQGGRCQALELVEPGPRRYNDLVCQGIARMEQGANETAIRALEEASTISFPDVPNFKLFPRLAVLYWRTGNRQKAVENLDKARLSLMVLIGVFKCTETPAGFLLLDPRGQAVEGSVAEDIRGRMCGAAYESYYGYAEGPFDDELLKRFAADARLVKNYLDAATTVVQPK